MVKYYRLIEPLMNQNQRKWVSIQKWTNSYSDLEIPNETQGKDEIQYTEPKKELKRGSKQNLVDNTLESWANQGVLLMNTALTVEDGKPASHAVNWMGFSDYIIDYLNKNMKNLVYVAWGAFAYNKLKNIDTKNNVLLVTSHPSPLSANSKFRTFPAFMGSDIFNNINKHLINLSKEEV